MLVAEDDLSNADIAAAVGVARQTLDLWKLRPEFKARAAEHVAELEAAVSRYAVAKRRKRVAIIQGQVDRLLGVIEERAVGMAGVSFGTGTGLLVHQTKVVGTGQNQQTIDEYVVDTGTLKELREHLKQAAQEVGQWSDKQEVTGANGGPIEVEQRGGLPDAERALRLVALFDAVRGRLAQASGRPESVGALGRPADDGLPE